MKNKLFGTRVYLCGAMDRVKDGGIGWRQMITPFLNSLGSIVLDPCDKPTTEAVEDAELRRIRSTHKKKGEWDKVREIMKPIRAVDLRLVDISDYIVVNLDSSIHACGTYEEIFLANREKKPIIIHVEDGKTNTPDWLFATVPHEMIFEDWDDIKKYLRNINSGKNIETFNRWQFFDMEKATKLMMERYQEAL